MAEKTMDKLKKIFGFADEYEYEDFDEDFEDESPKKKTNVKTNRS